MSFQDIKGAGWALEYLKKCVKKGRIASAYLFYGNGEWLRKRVAKEFAKALNCSEAKNEEPCDKCLQCQKIEKEIHPDCIFVSPQGAASRIGIDRIREIKRSLNLFPVEGKWRVIIIQQAHRMTQEASNALLKILEEPPPQTTFLLLAPHWETLLPTISSRCQKVKFEVSSLEDILLPTLIEAGYEEEEAKVFVEIYGGEERVKELWKEVDFWKKRREIIEKFLGKKKESLSFYLDGLYQWVEDWHKKWKKNIERRVKEVEEKEGKGAAKERESLWEAEVEEKRKILVILLINMFYSLFVDALKIKKGEKELVNRDIEGKIRKIAELDENYLEEWIGELEEMKRLVERNVNLSLLLGYIGLKIYGMGG